MDTNEYNKMDHRYHKIIRDSKRIALSRLNIISKIIIFF